MQTPWLALAETPLTPDIVRRIETAAAAIGRLDARVSASFARGTWQERSLLTGASATLAGRRQSVAEIDLFTADGITLPARSPARGISEGVQLIANWRAALARHNPPHWRELVAVPLDIPEYWPNHPGLLRALALTAHHAGQAGPESVPVLPHLLQALGLTRAVLPNLALADPAWSYHPRDVAASARRMLQQLAAAADAGLARLHRLERDQLRAAEVLGGQTRPGGLREVLALAEAQGAVTPRGLAARCDLSLSGAGKQLARAAGLGLLVEVTGRTSWRTYLVPDLARQFGFLTPPRGRPPSPALPPAPLDSTLAAFDAEMAAIDALLARTADTAGEGL